MILSSVICCTLFIPIFIYLQYVIMLSRSLLATIAAMLSAQLLLLLLLFFIIFLFSSLSYHHYYQHHNSTSPPHPYPPQHVPPREHTTNTLSNMMGHRNIYAVHHGLLRWSFNYSKSKSSVCYMLSEFCCLVALLRIVDVCPFLFPHQYIHRTYI